MARTKACLVALALATTSARAFAEPAPADADKPKPAAPAKPTPKAKAKAPEAKTVETLTVTGAAPDVETSIDRRSYTLGKDLQAATGSLADALRNVPSVDVDLQGNLSLRGDSNVTILVDGKPSPAFEGKGRADALQQLPADQIERVEVITNPSAALNPEGTGGVINLITKKSHGAGVTGSAYATIGSAGLKREGGSFGYNSNKLSITGSLSGNYQRNKQQGHDVRSSLDPASGVFLDHRHDFIGRNIARGPSGRLSLDYAATAKDQLSLSANYNELLLYGHPFDHFTDFAANGAQTGLLNLQGHRRFEEIDDGLTADWKHTFGEGHDLSVDLVANQSRPRDENTTTTFQSIPPSPFNVEAVRDDATQKHSELKVAYGRPLPGGATLKTGYELKYDDDAFDYDDARGLTATTLAPVQALANHFRFKQTIDTAYATYERTFGDLGVQGGLRLEDVRFELDQHTSGQHIDHAYRRAYPSLHLSYKLDDDDKLTASFSHRVQRPPSVLLNPLVYVIDPKTTQQGNPNLRPKDAQSFELGYEHRQGQASYTATLFYHDNRDEVSQVLIDRGNGVLENTFENVGSSHVAGLELVANGKFGPKLTYNATTTTYWVSVDPGDPTLGGVRSGIGVSGRANLNWQASAEDLLQLNVFIRARGIAAQGIFEPNGTLNFGWRHKFSDRITATVTAQDVLGTNRFTRRLDTPVLHDLFKFEPVSRAYFLRLDYRFGGGKKPAKDPTFEYDNGAPPQP